MSHDVDDQRRHWEGAYLASQLAEGTGNPSQLAEETMPLVEPGRLVLELGCGPGVDAAHFARSGHSVVALDFSTVAIERARARYSGQAGLSFVVADVGASLPFADAAFGLVYARLSLHYFGERQTQQVMAEIARVLERGGRLVFACRSVDDPLYGRGETVEPDMYVLDGHVRHFFSVEYARACLGPLFQAERIESGQETLYGRPAGTVTVVARRPREP